LNPLGSEAPGHSGGSLIEICKGDLLEGTVLLVEGYLHPVWDALDVVDQDVEQSLGLQRALGSIRGASGKGGDFNLLRDLGILAEYDDEQVLNRFGLGQSSLRKGALQGIFDSPQEFHPRQAVEP
jgi:hypothetical protein